MRIVWSGVLAALMFGLMGCASAPPQVQRAKITGNPKEPPWVAMGGDAEPGRDQWFTAVGNSMKDLNPALTKKRAEDRARQELARTVQAECVGLIRDFMEAHKDYVDPKATGSSEFSQYVSKTVAASAINNSSVRNAWTNDMDGSHWVLMGLSRLDFYRSVQATIAKAARERVIVSKQVDPKLVNDLQAHIVQKSQAPVTEKDPFPLPGAKGETIVPGIKPMDPSRGP